MEFVTKPTITLSRAELGELFGDGKPTGVGLSDSDIRLFLGLQKNEYKNKADLEDTLKDARNRIKHLNTLLPKIEKKIEEVYNLGRKSKPEKTITA